MLIIYHLSRINAKYENMLMAYFKQKHEVKKINKNYIPSANLLNISVPKAMLITKLQNTNLLPIKKKNEALRILNQNKIPNDIFIAKQQRRISFDFVIIDKLDTYYIELHEKQHRQMSVKKPSKIYDSKGNMIVIPRYLQRLIRDCWRYDYSSRLGLNYTIIWYDWFSANINQIPNLLSKGKKEYYNNGKFNFTSF